MADKQTARETELATPEEAIEAPEVVEETRGSNADHAPVDQGPPPSETPLIDAIDATPLEQAEARLEMSDASLADLDEARQSGDPAAQAAYDQAIAQRGAELAEIVAGLSPEERAAFMDGGGTARFEAALGAAVESGDPAVLDAVVGSLAGAGELVDDASVAALADAIDRVGLAEVAPALEAAMRGGAGARLAVELAYGQGDLYDNQTRADFLTDVNDFLTSSDFRMAQTAEVANQLRSQLITGMERMRAAGMSEESILAFETEFRAEHAAEFEAFEAAAATYATTLGGRAHGKERFGAAHHPFSLASVDTLQQSEAGGPAVAEALLRAGQGEPTWLDQAAPEDVEQLATMGAMQGIGALSVTGDLDGIDDVLAGLESAHPGFEDGALAGMRERLAAVAEQDLSGEELQAAILEALDFESIEDPAVRAVMERVHISAQIGTAIGVAGGAFSALDAASGESGGIGRLGTGFSALSKGISALTTDDPLRAGLNIAGLGADVLSLIGKLGSGSSLAAGAIFSVVDAGLHLRDGNYAAAGVALVPALGMAAGALYGSYIGSAGGLAGAMVGGALGAVTAGVLGALGVGAPDVVADLIAPYIAADLAARGMPPYIAEDVAELLAMPDTGAEIAYAAATMGMDMDTLLAHLAKAPAGYATWFVETVRNGLELQREEDGFDRPVQTRETAVMFETIWSEALHPETVGPAWSYQIRDAKRDAEAAVPRDQE